MGHITDTEMSDGTLVRTAGNGISHPNLGLARDHSMAIQSISSTPQNGCIDMVHFPHIRLPMHDTSLVHKEVFIKNTVYSQVQTTQSATYIHETKYIHSSATTNMRATISNHLEPTHNIISGLKTLEQQYDEFLSSPSICSDSEQSAMHYTTQETSTVFGQISDSSNKFSSLGSQSYKQSTCKMTSTSSTFPFFSTYAEATNLAARFPENAAEILSHPISTSSGGVSSGRERHPRSMQRNTPNVALAPVENQMDKRPYRSYFARRGRKTGTTQSRDRMDEPAQKRRKSDETNGHNGGGPRGRTLQDSLFADAPVIAMEKGRCLVQRGQTNKKKRRAETDHEAPESPYCRVVGYGRNPEHRPIRKSNPSFPNVFYVSDFSRNRGTSQNEVPSPRRLCDQSAISDTMESTTSQVSTDRFHFYEMEQAINSEINFAQSRSISGDGKEMALMSKATSFALARRLQISHAGRDRIGTWEAREQCHIEECD